jgi:hypothetical protein
MNMNVKHIFEARAFLHLIQPISHSAHNSVSLLGNIKNKKERD